MPERLTKNTAALPLNEPIDNAAPIGEVNGRTPSTLGLTPSSVALALVVFAIIWISAISLTSLSPPVDNMEQLTWVRSLEWGYYKHPPLPTWLIWLPVKAFGISAWASYLMGGVMTLGAMAIMWRLLVTLRGSAFADLALLSALCITYYNGRLYYYNHNVVLLFMSAASAALLWQAYSTRHLRWWIALGMAIGLGALTKYQIAVTILSGLVFLCSQRAWRDPAHRLGLLCAGLTGLLIFVPHIAWLNDHDFGPISYAVDSSLGANLGAVTRIKQTWVWLTNQLLTRAAPAFVLLAVAAWQLRTLGPANGTHLEVKDVSPRDPARALIFAWGALPLCLVSFVSLFFGADLKGHWGTPFLIFVVPAAMELAPRGFWDRCHWRKVLWAFLVIQGLLQIWNYRTSLKAPAPFSTHHWRNFDSGAYEKSVGEPARAELGGPIRVVIGGYQEAVTLAYQLAEKPLVLIDGRMDRSPWVSSGMIERCGAVEVGATNALEGAKTLGPMLPGLSWRVRMPEPSAAPCELK